MLSAEYKCAKSGNQLTIFNEVAGGINSHGKQTKPHHGINFRRGTQNLGHIKLTNVQDVSDLKQARLNASGDRF